MEIDSYAGLRKILGKQADAALEEVAERVYDLLLKCIDDTVYASPEGYYKRNKYDGGFIAGFELKKIKEAIKEIVYNGNNLTREGNNGYSHGNPEGADRRNDMWWILADAYSNVMESDWVDPGARYLNNPMDSTPSYLDVFKDKMNKHFNTWLKQAFKRKGIYL